MRIDGEPVGVLQALNPRRAAFDRADAEALLIVAAQAAVAIHVVTGTITSSPALMPAARRAISREMEPLVQQTPWRASW